MHVLKSQYGRHAFCQHLSDTPWSTSNSLRISLADLCLSNRALNRFLRSWLAGTVRVYLISVMDLLSSRRANNILSYASVMMFSEILMDSITASHSISAKQISLSPSTPILFFDKLIVLIVELSLII